MILAIIDLGTNTFNLLVYDTEKQVYLENRKVAVHLGKGGLKAGMLMPDSVERGIACIKEHLKLAAQHGAEECHAFACSAVRSAKNRDEFVEEVFQKTGLKVKVLSGEEEAEWIFKGVKLAIPIGEKPVLVMDIGGGSTELIVGNAAGVQWLKSYDLGVSRLLELFSPTDPLSEKDEDDIRSHIRHCWNDIPKLPPIDLIGSSGSFDTLAALYLGSKNIEMDSTNGLRLPLESLAEICETLRTFDETQRRRMPGMDLSRVHHIHLSAILLEEIRRKVEVQSITVSNFALKEGAVEAFVV
ncbi:MAG: hypothetical protein JJU02_15590 [Cryomorphaceae bacterium]|nr:hypothetical protein [Cryomorphaceae bacterium]